MYCSVLGEDQLCVATAAPHGTISRRGQGEESEMYVPSLPSLPSPHSLTLLKVLKTLAVLFPT